MYEFITQASKIMAIQQRPEITKTKMYIDCFKKAITPDVEWYNVEGSLYTINVLL